MKFFLQVFLLQIISHPLGLYAFVHPSNSILNRKALNPLNNLKFSHLETKLHQKLSSPDKKVNTQNTSAGDDHDDDDDEDADKFDANGYRKGSLMAATAAYGRVPYGEESRKYRRTVFDYDDWVTHRNAEKKIVTNIQGMFFSGVIRQLKEEVLFVTIVAAIVVVWNDFLIFPDEFLNGFTVPKLVLPALPFTLSSPALGLLLVFKTNASYARWSEARTTWAKVVAQSRNMVRMASTFVPGEEGDGSREKIQDLSNAVWLLSRSMMNSLLGGFEDEEDFREQVMSVYSGSAEGRLIAQKIVDSEYRTMAALAHASRTLDNVPIDEKRRVEIDKSLVIVGDCICVCEKIYTSPVPLVCECNFKWCHSVTDV